MVFKVTILHGMATLVQGQPVLNEMNVGMTHAPGAGSFNALPLCYG